MKIYPINNISYPQIQNQKSENISFGKLSNNKKENLKIAAWYINAFLLGFLGAYGIKCKMEDDKINQPKSVNKSVEHNNSVAPDTVCYQEYMLDTFNTDSKAKTTNLPNSVQVDSIINNIEKDFVTKNKNSKKDLASLKKLKQDFSEKSRKLDSLGAIIDNANADIDTQIIALNNESSVHQKSQSTVTGSAKSVLREAPPVKRTQKVKTATNKDIIKVNQIVLVLDRHLFNRHSADLSNVYLIDSKGKLLETKDYVKLIQRKSPQIYQTSIFDKNDKLLLKLESHFDYSSSYRYLPRGYYRKHSGNAKHLSTSILYNAKNIDVSNAKLEIAK